MKTTEYLDAARRKTGSKTSAALAEALGVTGGAMSRYESGERVIDDYTAARVAELLNIDPMQVIAQANAEREKDENRKSYWQRIAHMSVRTAACVTVTTIAALTAPSSADAASADKGGAIGIMLSIK